MKVVRDSGTHPLLPRFAGSRIQQTVCIEVIADGVVPEGYLSYNFVH
jgi:hypothetical protein